MRVPPEQITTEEVKSWQGLHLLHFQSSTCSQKVRILLREKGLEWTSHPIDLPRNEHVSEWFLGINSRGVVPVLVHDGEVHVESNDILAYLDTHTENLYQFRDPSAVYLHSYHLLHATNAPRAEPLLDVAHAALQSCAERIESSELRQSFLDNVASNREILLLSATLHQ